MISFCNKNPAGFPEGSARVGVLSPKSLCWVRVLRAGLLHQAASKTTHQHTSTPHGMTHGHHLAHHMAPQHTSTQAHQHTSTISPPAHQPTSTPAPQHISSPALQATNTPAHRHKHTSTPAGQGVQGLPFFNNPEKLKKNMGPTLNAFKVTNLVVIYFFCLAPVFPLFL